MTLRRARKYFREYIQPYVIILYGPNDIAAIDLAFNEWVAAIHSDGTITDRQLHIWTRE